MRDLVDLRKTLDETADRIAETEENPASWDTLVLYLVEALEARAMGQDGGDDAYLEMVAKVRDGLSDRLDQGFW